MARTKEVACLLECVCSSCCCALGLVLTAVGAVTASVSRGYDGKPRDQLARQVGLAVVALGLVFVAVAAVFSCVRWIDRKMARARRKDLYRRQRRMNQLSGVTEPSQTRNSQYRDLHIDIPPHADFYVQESPPPSYEASSFSKPVATPPPTYSAAVDLAGTPPVWDVPAVHQPSTTPRQAPRDGDGSPTRAVGGGACD